MSVTRKAVRDWFKDALAAKVQEIGSVYTSRWQEIGSEEKNFVMVYLTSGEPVPDFPAITESEMVIVIYQKLGDDDSLDVGAAVVMEAIDDYEALSPSPFDYYETGYSYSGDSDDPTRAITLQLTITH